MVKLSMSTDITIRSSWVGSIPLKSLSVNVMGGILGRTETRFTWWTACRCFFRALLELSPLVNPLAMVLMTSWPLRVSLRASRETRSSVVPFWVPTSPEPSLSLSVVLLFPTGLGASDVSELVEFLQLHELGHSASEIIETGCMHRLSANGPGRRAVSMWCIATSGLRLRMLMAVLPN